jgi:hypothetical protein
MAANHYGHFDNRSISIFFKPVKPVVERIVPRKADPISSKALTKNSWLPLEILSSGLLFDK